jgi:hypothetical protein
MKLMLAEVLKLKYAHNKSSIKTWQQICMDNVLISIELKTSHGGFLIHVDIAWTLIKLYK